MFQEMMPMSQGESGGLQAYVGTITISSGGGSSGDIELGFVPKHIAIVANYTSSSSYKGIAIWDEANGTTFINTNTSGAINWRTLPGDGGIIINISGTKMSFTNGTTSALTYHYFAVG